MQKFRTLKIIANYIAANKHRRKDGEIRSER